MGNARLPEPQPPAVVDVGGPNLSVVDPAPIADDTATIDQFLDVMAFASQADRTNAVAAAVTVMLRPHFPGGKPLILCTATKSHSGKDTVINFAAGRSRLTSITYQSTDWAFACNGERVNRCGQSPRLQDQEADRLERELQAEGF